MWGDHKDITEPYEESGKFYRWHPPPFPVIPAINNQSLIYCQSWRRYEPELRVKSIYFSNISRFELVNTCGAHTKKTFPWWRSSRISTSNVFVLCFFCVQIHSFTEVVQKVQISNVDLDTHTEVCFDTLMLLLFLSKRGIRYSYHIGIYFYCLQCAILNRI